MFAAAEWITFDTKSASKPETALCTRSRIASELLRIASEGAEKDFSTVIGTPVLLPGV